MNVPNVAPNMPHVLPGMPNAAPGAPVSMQSQQAGQVPLGCAGCLSSSSTWAKIPLWAKVLVPVGIVGITIAIVVAVSNRRRVAPYAEAFEETDF